MALGPVYAICRQEGDPERPLARFRVEGAARTYAAVHEDKGTPVVILHRDEDPELGEPSSWREVYRTPAGS